MAICVVIDLFTIVPVSQIQAVDGKYTCVTGTYILLTPSELSSMNNNIFKATPADYIAVSSIFGAAMTALAVIWGVRRILRLFLTLTES